MKNFISKDVLEPIRQHSDLVDTISRYGVELKKNGRNFVACCPFHQEKTPSFYVNMEHQRYHCFGCGKKGDVFAFVMEMEHVDFLDAAKLLARICHITIPEPANDDSHPRKRLYLLHEKLAGHYMDHLAKNVNPDVNHYLESRKIPDALVKQFQLGAASRDWDDSISWAKKAEFSEAELLQCGVVAERSGGSGVYDRFRNRLIFPIWDERGKVVAFTSRSIEKNVPFAKYLNSPLSPIFSKSHTLYALHFAKKPISEQKYAVVCEGPMDVIAMHRAGCTMAVGLQGTACSAMQCELLSRYTKEIRLALDGDAAGIKAVFHIAKILLPLGVCLKVVQYPNAKDADELLSSAGEQALADAVAHAVDYFEFACHCFAKDKDITNPAEKASLARQMVEQIALLDNAIMQDVYASWLAEKLSLDKESLMCELASIRNNGGKR